jgi:hypothetical protein
MFDNLRIDVCGRRDSLTFNVSAENNTNFMYKIKRTAMQIGEIYLSLEWVCVCIAVTSNCLQGLCL